RGARHGEPTLGVSPDSYIGIDGGNSPSPSLPDCLLERRIGVTSGVARDPSANAKGVTVVDHVLPATLADAGHQCVLLCRDRLTRRTVLLSGFVMPSSNRSSLATVLVVTRRGAPRGACVTLKWGLVCRNCSAFIAPIVHCAYSWLKWNSVSGDEGS